MRNLLAFNQLLEMTDFVQLYIVKAVRGFARTLALLRPGELWHEGASAWMLAQPAVASDAPRVAAASTKHWGLIALATPLDSSIAAEALAAEWQAQSHAGLVHFFFNVCPLVDLPSAALAHRC
jgi:hypothetical protein